ncbi:type I-F CRISPR-associated endoribonuclease Cas6/Csy4 [Pseudomonas luteola]
MEQMSHYLDFVPPAEAINGLALTYMSALFVELHKARVRSNDAYPVDFPEFLREKMSIGRKIRVFGSKEGLKNLLMWPSIANLINGEMIEYRGIYVTPHTDCFVINTRKNTGTKISSERQREKKLERLKAHYARKGFEWTQEFESKILDDWEEWSFDELAEFISVHSDSSKMSFKLYINRVPSERAGSSFNGYGLALNNEGSVPSFL